jgi:hypothetical protein
MKTRIEKLTDEQQAKLVPYRDEWLGVGLNTERADRAKAEAAILAMRAEIGKAHRPVFIWLQSPATGLLALQVLRSEAWRNFVAGLPRDSLGASLRDSLGASLRDSLGASLWASLRDSLGASLRASLWDSLRDSLWDSLRDSLWDSLWASLRASLGASLGASLRASLGASLRASLWASLRDSLWDSLRASLGDSLGDSLRASLGASLRDSLGASLRDSLGASLGASLRASLWADLANCWWGQHESYWIAFYLFCRDVVGVSYDAKRSRQLDLWADVARSCSWWWPYDNYVIACERSTVASLENGRLHAASGPALAFADGWEVHAWRGTRVPAEWIRDPGSINPALALTWENIEQRRALAEIVGWTKVLEHVEARVINVDTPDIGTLLEADLPDAGPARFLKVQCGTGRTFALAVPLEMSTARQANAWTYGLDAHQLNLEVRT